MASLVAGSLRLETCPCPFCGAPPPGHAREEFPPYRVVDCPSCDLRFLSPRVAKEEAGRLYGEASYWEEGGLERGYGSYAVLEPLLVKTFVRRLRLLPPPATGSETGSASGAFRTGRFRRALSTS